MPKIEVIGLSKKYKGSRNYALKDVNFEFEGTGIITIIVWVIGVAISNIQMMSIAGPIFNNSFIFSLGIGF